jgi:hypothetical protein
MPWHGRARTIAEASRPEMMYLQKHSVFSALHHSGAPLPVVSFNHVHEEEHESVFIHVAASPAILAEPLEDLFTRFRVDVDKLGQTVCFSTRTLVIALVEPVTQDRSTQPKCAGFMLAPVDCKIDVLQTGRILFRSHFELARIVINARVEHEPCTCTSVTQLNQLRLE